MAIERQDIDGTDESILDYGINEAEVNKQIRNETIEALDLKRVPLEIAVKDIDKVSKEEFTQLRRTGLGGSDSSVVCGVNPYSTVEELIQSKIRTQLSEEEKAVGQLVAVRKGNDLEPLIISKATEIIGATVFKPPHMYRLKDFPYLTMNFDGVMDIEGKQYVPVEIKVCTYRGEKHYNKFKAMYDQSISEGIQYEVEDCSAENISIEERAAHYGIPPYYFTQVQQEMMALDAPYGYLAALFETDWYVRIFKIYKDPKTQNTIITNGYKIWNRIKALKKDTKTW